MLLAVEIFGILTMCTLMFVLIWGFIILNKIFNQMRYRNYLMEKLTEHAYALSNKKDCDYGKIYDEEKSTTEE